MQSQLSAQVAPVEALVVTVGGSPVPVLLALAALRPAHVVALVTRASHPVWDRTVEAAHRLVGWSGTSEVVTVVNHDPASTVEALAELERAGLRDWSLAYAGGTPTMSAVSFARWHSGPGSAGPGSTGTAGAAVPRAWYVAEAGDLLVSHDDVRMEQADVLGDSTLPLHGRCSCTACTPTASPRRRTDGNRYVPRVTRPRSHGRCEAAGLRGDGRAPAARRRSGRAVGLAIARVVADDPTTAVYRPVKAPVPMAGSSTTPMDWWS